MKSQHPREVWDTPRKCQLCLRDGNITFCKAEKWAGKEYKIFCPICGNFQLSKWDGRGFLEET